MSFDGWKEYKLGDLVDVAQGLAINAKSKFMLQDTGLPLLRITDLINDSKVQFINPKAVMKQCIAEDKDIIYTRTGQVGLVFKGKTGVIHNNCFKVIPKTEILDSNFLYWFLFQKSVREHANAIASGSVQKDLTHSAFKSIEIKIPSIKTQERIASILSSLDDKIKLNRQTNETQEAIAQALFKEWFVNFNFPDATGEMMESELGMIPKGWKVIRVNELLQSVSETHKFPKEEVIFLNTSDIEEGKVLHRNYSRVDTLPGQAKKSIKKLDILFTEIRPANKRYALIDFDADDFVVSTKLMVLRSKERSITILLYYFLISEIVLGKLQHLAESRSGTFPQITFDILGKLKIALPKDETLIKSFAKVTWKLFETCKNNERQNENIVQIRNCLLSKLMGGEIKLHY